MSLNLIEIAKEFPDKPGIYIFKDETERPIYVGKASRLSHRIRSYFGAESERIGSKNQRIRASAFDLDYIVTTTEAEALILENTLIKKHMPRFNVRLKDGKTYPYLKIDIKSDWPRISITRNVQKDGSRYFGPYFSASSLRKTMDLLNKLFPYRSCAKTITGTDPKPCLDFHINRCLGPCIGAVDSDAYQEVIKQVIGFLEGKHTDIIKNIKENMLVASRQKNYERAAILRDQIIAIEKVTQGQVAVSNKNLDEDVICLARKSDEAWAEVFFIRGGKLTGRTNFLLEGVSGEEDSDVLAGFLKQFYSGSIVIPSRIITETPVADSEAIMDWLKSKKGEGLIKLIVPKRGPEKKLIKLVSENAHAGLEAFHLKTLAAEDGRKIAMQEIMEELDLPHIPQRIECYDISNTQGSDSVGSMVVFENGKPKKSHYRRFKIKTVEGPNDFASLQEVIKRRFVSSGLIGSAVEDIDDNLSTKGILLKDARSKAKYQNMALKKDISFNTKPDLILIDGGKGQLSAVAEIMRVDLGLYNIPIASIAKKREEIFIPDSSESIMLPRNSVGLYLIQQLRDEAHRFAITFHRKLRDNRTFISELDLIPGIGPQKKKALLNYFGSLKNIKKAPLNDLVKVPGINARLALIIREYV